MKTSLYQAVTIVVLLGSLVIGCNDSPDRWKGTDLGWDDPDIESFGDNDPELYVVIGDGITSGYGLIDEPLWPHRLTQMLNKTVVNRSLKATRVEYGVANVEELLRNYKPGFLLIIYGTNDIGVGNDPTYIVNGLRFMVQMAHLNKTRAAVATLPPAFIDGEPTEVATFAIVNNLIRQMAVEEDAILVDLDLAFGGDPNLIILWDGLHPTVEGHQLIAQTFYDALPEPYKFSWWQATPASE